jgi:hypothetical protein
MNTYLALLSGRSEGCDYTVGCNLKSKVLNAENETDALELCKQVWEDYGRSQGQPRIEDISLFLVSSEIYVPVAEWNQDDEAARAKRIDERKLAEAEKQVAELRNRMAKR